MSDNRARQFALIVKALNDLDREIAEAKTGWKDRRTVLENQMAKLAGEELSGQLTLIPSEPRENESA
jgi:hypothetical protein